MIEKMLDWFHHAEPTETLEDNEEYYSLNDVVDQRSEWCLAGDTEKDQV